MTKIFRLGAWACNSPQSAKDITAMLETSGTSGTRTSPATVCRRGPEWMQSAGRAVATDSALGIATVPSSAPRPPPASPPPTEEALRRDLATALVQQAALKHAQSHERDPGGSGGAGRARRFVWPTRTPTC